VGSPPQVVEEKWPSHERTHRHQGSFAEVPKNFPKRQKMEARVAAGARKPRPDANRDSARLAP